MCTATAMRVGGSHRIVNARFTLSIYIYITLK